METEEMETKDMEKRIPQPTERGLLFWQENKRHSLISIVRKLKNIERTIEQLISEQASTAEVKSKYSVWLAFYEEFLELKVEYKELFQDQDTKSDFNEESNELQNFKENTEQWFLSETRKHSTDYDYVKESDSVSQRSKSKRSSSCGSKKSSSIISAKLKEIQRIAGLKAKAATLQEVHNLQFEKLKVTMAEENLKIKTEMAVSNARAKVLEDFDENNTEKIHKTSFVKLQTKYRYEPEIKVNLDPPHQQIINTQLNPDSQPFFPQVRYEHFNTLPNVTDNYVYNPQSQTQDFQNTKPTKSEYPEDAMLHIVQHLRKPLPEIKKFTGDPLEFRKFMRQFDTKIVQNSTSDEENLNYLEQFTSGEAHTIVSSCSQLNGKQGYPMAITELEDRYGRDNVLASAFVKRATSRPTIKGDNSKGLDEFAIFLAECNNAIKCIEAVKILEFPDNIKILVAKLPYNCHDKWRNIVERTRSQGQEIQFQQLSEFVKTEARKATDPTFGKDALSSLQNTEKSGNTKQKGQYKGGKTSFVTKTLETENIDQNHTTQHKQEGFSQSNKVKSDNLTNKPCDYCQNTQHIFQNCDKFRELSIKERVEYVKSKGYCFGCMKRGHRKSDCRSRATCTICQGRRHPTGLHDSDWQYEQKNKQPEPIKAYSNFSKPLSTGAGDGICTMAVNLRIKDTTKVIRTLAFLDPGSSATFCTEQLMQNLGAEGAKVKITLDTMAAPVSITTYAVSGLEICDTDFNNVVQLPKVYTKDIIPITRDHIPTQKDISAWQHLQDINIKEVNEDIGLLIGNNAADAYRPLEVRPGPRGSPFATRTLLGWVVCSLVREPEIKDSCKVYSVNRADILAVSEINELNKLDAAVQRAINMDFPERASDERKELSQEDKKFLEIVDSSMKLVDGHYVMPLPFRHDNVQLPNNREQALKRLNGLKNKMKRNPDFHKDYCEFMTGILEEGYGEKVPDSEIEREDNKIWYIPHHGVYHPKKKDKIRVVFDCAAQYMGISLNSLLLSGPDMTNHLLAVLLRFRQGRIAVMADIKSMFFQVRLPPDDRDVLRFYWWPEGDFYSNPTVYRMTVHLFGAISSPSCCNSALRRTADDNKGNFDKNTFETVTKSFYVDDCLKSVDTEEEAIQLSNDVTELCQRGGFHLHKWVSNSPAVVEAIPVEQRAKDLKHIDLDKETLPNERALGVHWAVEEDSFGFNITVQDKPATRRNVLSIKSSIYDPMGISSPFTLTGKQLLQDLCRQGMDWDEPLTGHNLRIWEQWIKDIPELESISLSRCFKSPNLDQVTQSDLHLFSDASEKGFGVVAYLRYVDKQDNIHCSFVMAKSRVVPLKKITVPRLELTAATLAVKLSIMIKRELELAVKATFWTDSMSVLRYIQNETSRFQTFVANRVSVIRDVTEPNQWKYIESAQNPADPASRGQRMKEFVINETWLKGPAFLWQPKATWPTQQISTILDNDDPELKKLVTSTICLSENQIDKLLKSCSKWWKLKRIVGWILLGISNLKNWVKTRKHLEKDVPLNEPDVRKHKALIENKMKDLKKSSSSSLTDDLLEKAEQVIICYVQTKDFSEEIENLTSGESISQKLRKTSSIRNLDPFILDKVLRVGGRIERSGLQFGSKHPVLLPKNSPVSRLILDDAHRKSGHMVKNYILATTRERYWIVGASSILKSMLSKCVTCRKYQAKSGEQKMASLPTDRLTPEEPPFTRVGMDFFGPFPIKQGQSTVKRYGVVFTCLAIRAIHLELTASMDTDSCINAIRRFIARRGSIKIIRCDNGANLVGSKNELEEEIRKWNLTKIDTTLQQKGIKWVFNPPLGSHFGGAWERMIRSVRKILHSLLQEQTIKLTDESLHTLFCEVEAIVNSRPLTELPSHPSDIKALTPNDLLMLQSGDSLPPGLFDSKDTYVRRRWRRIQYLADVFWKRWTREYLPSLQQRQRWISPRRNLSVGDLVLLVDNMPRLSWALGRVIDVMKDSKGFVRMVTVKTKSSTLVRPIDKLCLILESDIESHNMNSE